MTGVTAYTETSASYKIQSVDKKVGYGYRVDYDLRQKLVNKTIEGEQRAVNNSNYNDLYGFTLNNSIYSDGNYSFSTIFATLQSAFPDKFSSIINVGTSDESLKDTFKKTKFTQVTVRGSATRQDDKNSVMLARRRAESVTSLLYDSGIDAVKWETGTTKPSVILNDPSDINTKEAKEQRYVVVEMIMGAEKTNTIGSIATNGIDTSFLEAANRVTTETRTVVENNENGVPVIKEKRVTNATAPAVAQKLLSTNSNATRYENEAEYFYKLKDTDPLVFKNLVNKFKYFNPAFHSMSPEGFNARLTFLQQCTRQGHTIEASSPSGYDRTAGNLAFGRMPVCVLRIGDFINTKILIRSISMNYGSSGPMQFDLNQEGIGIQPMYAKISMQVTIVGGQSLEGPINRLQNAVTFNYYSNTQVYDDRSDVRSQIDDYGNGTVSYDRLWVPFSDIENK